MICRSRFGRSSPSLVRTVGTDAVRAFFCKIAHQRDACSSPRRQDRARSIRFGGAIYDFARASRHAAVIAVRAPCERRTARRPSVVILKNRFARPPRSGVGAPIDAVTMPLASSRWSVT